MWDWLTVWPSVWSAVGVGGKILLVVTFCFILFAIVAITGAIVDGFTYKDNRQ